MDEDLVAVGAVCFVVGLMVATWARVAIDLAYRHWRRRREAA